MELNEQGGAAVTHHPGMMAIPVDVAVVREPQSEGGFVRPERPGVTSVGGIMEMRSLSQLMADERAAAEQKNSAPEIAGLAGHIRKCWVEAREAKEETVEKRMLQNLRQRRGEYDPETLARLREQNSAVVYMLVTSNKCRSAAAWLNEALSGMPWGCQPSPVADIDPQTQEGIVRLAETEIAKAMMMGVFPSDADVRDFMLAVRDQAFARMQETAKARAERMTEKMKDQLTEGGFSEAITEFVDDLVTFPAAILKGPVVRTRPQLQWKIGPRGETTVEPQDTFKLEWERVDPFNLYPAPDATTVDDGYLIERHRLSRSDLVSLRDVEGYSAEAINAVLDEYGKGGLTEWLVVDSDRELAEGRSMVARTNPSELIDALQFWGSVQGKMLIEWGIPESDVSDPLAEYHIEAWLIGSWVIKATINPDPLHRKPYYKTSWENIPGCFWGRSIPDLCADTQAVCNAAARTLVNNMSIASGPQVVVDSSRIPTGVNLTEMYPWKIWQYRDNGLGSGAQPINFFQPGSNAAELMGIYEKFSLLADEYTGIPRYMTGDGSAGGAGRTASGMSMLMSNAGKSIKNVVSNIDRVLKPAIERLYFYNMRYLDDPELKGDVNIVVDGAVSMVQKQQQQQRLNEFLTISTTNPVINQLVGPEGIAYMLREVAKTLGMDTDKIIPPLPVLKARAAQQQLVMQQQMLMQQAQQIQQEQGNPASGGTPARPDAKTDNRRLADGSPQVNTRAQLPPGAPPVG